MPDPENGLPVSHTCLVCGGELLSGEPIRVPCAWSIYGTLSLIVHERCALENESFLCHVVRDAMASAMVRVNAERFLRVPGARVS